MTRRVCIKLPFAYSFFFRLEKEYLYRKEKQAMENTELIVSIVHVILKKSLRCWYFCTKKTICLCEWFVKMCLYFAICRDFRLKILS